MTIDPVRVAPEPCVTGEGPLWHPERAVLFWVDIPNGHLNSYDPATDAYERRYEAGRAIGGATLQADGSLLLFEGGGAIERWQPGDGAVTQLRSELPDETDSRFNDVVADPRGRVFAGTMPTDDRLGRLYRADVDGTVTQVDDGLDIPNGMSFSLDRSTLYVAVSEDHVIYAYDYEQATGTLSNRRTFVDTSDELGVPDGLTVDAEDHVWSARWNDGCVVRYAPDGTEDRRIDVPPPKASSVAFGGPNYEDLYVTTAIGEGDDADEHPEAGSLYRLDVDVRGVPDYRSRVDV